MNRPPTHPGAILADELAERGLSANRLALDLGVPSGRITAILGGKRAVTPDTAIRLATYLGTSPQVWLNLQAKYDLAVTEREQGESIRAQVRRPAA